MSLDGTFRMGTRTGRFDAVEVEPGTWSVLVDGISHTVVVKAAGGFRVDGLPADVEVIDPRMPRKKHSGLSSNGRETLKADMPGRVIRVLVPGGGQVESGQGILVVEAMKMQNEVKSPKSGTVLQVHVQEGDTVGAGDLLAVVE